MEIERAKASQILEEIQTEGHRPLKAIADNFEVYIVKSGKGHQPPFTLINEFLCALLLKFWDIPTPEIALIDVDPALIDIPISLQTKRFHYQYPCFGSKLVQEAFDAHDLFEMKSRFQFQRLEDPFVLLSIALFNMWVGNEDRTYRNANLLYADHEETGKIRIYAIDHAQSFFYLGYEHLKPGDGFFLPENNSILEGEIGKDIRQKIKKAHKQSFQDQFFEKVIDCKKNFFNIAAVLPKELGFTGCMAIFISNFLFDRQRNDEVFADFLRRL